MPIKYPSARAGLEGVTQDFPPLPDKSDAAAADRVTGLDALELAGKSEKGSLGKRIWREQQLTVLFVTHNVREAVRLGDRVILLSSRPGRVIEDYAITHQRPRRIDSPEVAGQAAEITDRLRAEVARHAH